MGLKRLLDKAEALGAQRWWSLGNKSVGTSQLGLGASNGGKRPRQVIKGSAQGESWPEDAGGSFRGSREEDRLWRPKARNREDWRERPMHVKLPTIFQLVYQPIPPSMYESHSPCPIIRGIGKRPTNFLNSSITNHLFFKIANIRFFKVHLIFK